MALSQTVALAVFLDIAHNICLFSCWRAGFLREVLRERDRDNMGLGYVAETKSSEKAFGNRLKWQYECATQ